MKKQFYQTTIRLAIILTVITLICTCKKKEQDKPIPVLPAITTVGANTFGGIIDDELWLPHERQTEYIKNLCSANQVGTISFYLYCDRNASDNGGKNYFSFSRTGVLSPGSYDLTNPNNSYIVLYKDNSDGYFDNYKITSGKLTVLKIDSVAKIMSGQFECVVTNNTKNITYNITSGRFDLQIGYCQ